MKMIDDFSKLLLKEGIFKVKHCFLIVFFSNLSFILWRPVEESSLYSWWLKGTLGCSTSFPVWNRELPCPRLQMVSEAALSSNVWTAQR